MLTDILPPAEALVAFLGPSLAWACSPPLPGSARPDKGAQVAIITWTVPLTMKATTMSRMTMPAAVMPVTLSPR